MPKLYYTPSSCGASVFISAYVAGVSMECETVDLQSKKTASGADYLVVNEKGNVPCIVLEDGSTLIEGAINRAA